MLELKRTNIDALKDSEKEIYRDLILPDQVDFFNFPRPTGEPSILVEARLNHELVGLALAKNFLNSRRCELKSLFVKEIYRRQGIGKALFDYLLKTVGREDKMSYIRFFFDKSTASGKAMSQIIGGSGWAPPALHVVRLIFDAYAFDPDWIHDLYPLPAAITLFPWKNRSVNDIWRIEHLEEQGRFLPSVSPLRQESSIEYYSSLGMRHNNKLIGWVINHKLDTTTVRYSSLYIDQFFNRSGFGIRLLAESIRLIKQLPVTTVIFEINVNEIDRTWGLFVKKRLTPLSKKIEMVHQAIHSLETSQDVL